MHLAVGNFSVVVTAFQRRVKYSIGFPDHFEQHICTITPRVFVWMMIFCESTVRLLDTFIIRISSQTQNTVQLGFGGLTGRMVCLFDSLGKILTCILQGLECMNFVWNVRYKLVCTVRYKLEWCDIQLNRIFIVCLG